MRYALRILYAYHTCRQRVDAAKSNIESLNPLVTVETVSDPSVLEGDALDKLLDGVDMVCVTDSDRNTLVSTHPRLAVATTRATIIMYMLPRSA